MSRASGRTDPATAAAAKASAAAAKRWPGVSIAIDDCGGKYYFDAHEADRACDFFPTFLKHPAGPRAGEPFELEPWQRELVVRPVFGWKRKADGLRRFRKVSLWIPKKNGKSSLGAGVALYLLFCDGEEGAEVYSAASDRQQAGIVFGIARAMVQDSPELAAMSEVYTRSVVYPARRSAYVVLSADVKSKHGPNVHGLLFDELHTLPNRELYDTLRKGIIAREQPLVFQMSTAGDDDESIAREEYDYAQSVVNRVIEDETLLPVVFEADAKDDWRSPKVWSKANPSLGATFRLEAFEQEFREAEAEPRKRASFLRLNLNRWTQQSRIWIPLEDWDACQATPRPPGRDERTIVAAGLDLSSKLDLSALSVGVRRPLDRAIKVVVKSTDDQGAQVSTTLAINYVVDVFAFFWIPEATMLQREKEDRIPYSLWVERGFLRATEGNVIDYDTIRAQIRDEIGPRFRLKDGEIGYDPWNATQLALQLQDDGFQMVEVRQGYQTLSEPSKAFEALIAARWIRHDGNGVARWCVGNVAVKEDANENIRPVKPAKKKRIDFVAATVTMLSRLMLATGPTKSVYGKRAEAGDKEVLRWV